MSKHIAVFCAANNVSEDYVKATALAVHQLALDGWGFIYGGEESGLMKIVADEAEKSGSTLIAIGSEHLRERMRKGVREVIIAENNQIRNQLFLERSEAILVLPGGIGTLDECTSALRANKWNSKPILVLNVSGFYNGLKMQLDRMRTEGLLADTVFQHVHFVKDGEAMMTTLLHYKYND